MIISTSVLVRIQKIRRPARPTPFTKAILKKKYPRHSRDNNWLTNKIIKLKKNHNKYNTLFQTIYNSEDEVHNWIRSKISSKIASENKFLTDQLSKDIFNFDSEIVQLLEYNDGQYVKFIMSEHSKDYCDYEKVKNLGSSLDSFCGRIE
eukprot:Pgem_evm1s15278